MSGIDLPCRVARLVPSSSAAEPRPARWPAAWREPLLQAGHDCALTGSPLELPLYASEAHAPVHRGLQETAPQPYIIPI